VKDPFEDGTPIDTSLRARMANRPTDGRTAGSSTLRALALVLMLLVATCGGIYQFSLKPAMSEAAAGYGNAASAPRGDDKAGDAGKTDPSGNKTAPGAPSASAPAVGGPPQAVQVPASGPKVCTSSRGGGCYNWQPINGTCIWSGAKQPENIRLAKELFDTPYLKLDQRVARLKSFKPKPGPEPGTIKLGFAPEHWNAYCKLAMSESGFRKDARGPYVGILEGGKPRGYACGIPQALPCDKMGPGNRNGYTELTAWEQIVWQLVYIHERYKSNPSAAWEHAWRHHWY
jgi:hypothetical protein